VAIESLGYLGGMVSYYSGKVSRGQIVIRDVDLPEGTAVTVLVTAEASSLRLTATARRELAASLAESERGETVSLDEALATLRGEASAVRGPGHAAGAPAARGDARVVAGAPRRRASRARSRAGGGGRRARRTP
jgi:hypothetical protein